MKACTFAIAALTGVTLLAPAALADTPTEARTKTLEAAQPQHGALRTEEALKTGTAMESFKQEGKKEWFHGGPGFGWGFGRFWGRPCPWGGFGWNGWGW